MRYLLSVLVVLVVTSAARAEISGVWSGVGEFYSTDGYNAECGLVRMTFSKLKDSLKIDQTVLCGQASGDLTVVLKIKGTDLYSQSFKVGTMTDTEISFKGAAPTGVAGEYSLSAKVKDGKMEIEDKLQYSNSFGYDSVFATLEQ